MAKKNGGIEQLSVSESVYKGVASTILENDFLRVEVIEFQGGHIASLYDKSKQRELLWQNKEKEYKVSAENDSFELGECAGIDDMLPCAAKEIIAGGDFDGVSLPDHGELWTMKAETREQGNNSIKLAFRGKCLPYRLVKDISIEGETLRIDYTLKNISAKRLDFLWAAHPLFDAKWFDTVDIPAMSRTVTIPFHVGVQCEPSLEYEYPNAKLSDGTKVDFRKIPEAKSGLGYKFMSSAPLRKGQCTISDSKSGYAVEVNFPAEKIPYIGVWTLAGKPEGGGHVVAPEPSTARSVFYNEKSDFDTGTVDAFHEFCWWIEYKLVNKASKKREGEI